MKLFTSRHRLGGTENAFVTTLLFPANARSGELRFYLRKRRTRAPMKIMFRFSLVSMVI